MPGLIRGVARTAVVAGTATAVSNNVSRRQANRWATKDQQAQMDAYQQQQYAQAQYAQQSPPPQQVAYEQPAALPAEPAAPSIADQIQELAKLHSAGVLSDEEFAAAKAKLISG